MPAGRPSWRDTKMALGQLIELATVRLTAETEDISNIRSLHILDSARVSARHGG